MSSNGQHSATGNASPEHSNEHSREGSHASGEDEGHFNTEIISAIDGVIERFRSSSIPKSDTILEILSFIRTTNVTPASQNIAFSNYLTTIDTIESQGIEAHRRGLHASDGLGDSAGRSGSGTISDPSRETDDAVAEILGSIVAEAGSATSSKRGRDQSSDSESSSSGEESNTSGEDRHKGKKKSVRESKMPWHRRELKARKNASPSCIKTRKLLKYFGRNTGEVKQLIKLSQTAPLGFPSSEWDNIIKGNPVNLDIVLSSLHHLGAPEENTGRLGSTEIKLGQNEPTRKVQTSGDWTSTWNAAIKATVFIFKHRETELRSYAEYVEGLFASKITSSHHLIISFDKAIRAEVAGAQACLLTDYHRFTRLQTAIMSHDGVEASHRSKKRFRFSQD
ncbi:hypothetical protein Hypma_006532 [Hypsizygus marmoreus]|uniref:Uncharacterized protein n=1 Tax=Hypsizygus marmoreus TaxID=39966 RepID=A0A369JUI8_HYPMA|nr:hypothetical protein Hypma_006532 [Hypsizygus marmoreus]